MVYALSMRLPTAVVPPNLVTYIPCPRCRKLMNRTNFGHASGIILDTCREDGIWLDRGELQAVLAFVQGGGLIVARAREKEMAKAEEQRNARVAAEVDAMRHSTDYHESSSPEGPAGVVVEALFRAALGTIFNR